ncbi:transcription/translation regulatory transformer protein RfaH [Thalassotalea maritima]|uniref:transcription/translation regulatory transformer protein RfaH n=1 Tax=Thalassotalea maritima TaxID=3242416 RepID=UPI003529AE81
MSKAVTYKWYVLTSKPRDEQRAYDNLVSQGYHCFLPKISKVKKRNGVKSLTLEPLFPNYLFIQLDDEQANFNAIRSTRGIGAFVRFGMNHATIDADIIEQIRANQAQSSQPKTLEQMLDYQSGDLVTIQQGPFQGLTAIYQAKDGLERSILMINMLGQQSPVSVGNDAFDKGEA